MRVEWVDGDAPRVKVFIIVGQVYTLWAGIYLAFKHSCIILQSYCIYNSYDTPLELGRNGGHSIFGPHYLLFKIVSSEFKIIECSQDVGLN
jgi:hypothetical protein